MNGMMAIMTEREDLMNLKGSVVFVTGANRGLGLAFAKAALSRGAAKVYAGMRSTQGFKEPGLVPIQIDVTDQASVAAAAASCQDVTLLINNAGIAAIIDSPLSADMESLSRRLLETNYYGVVRVTQAFSPALTRNGPAGIINVLSDVSWLPKPVLTPYSDTKAAAWSYTNHVRVYLKEQNIQVLGLHVGFVDTDLSKGVTEPKARPEDVVRDTFDALEAGKSEIMADVGTRALKRSLSNEVPGYIDPTQLA
jgi:NAD(P)-dependent dehydrogenase (short-subunit alcohol dehydrogenase family)